MTQDVHPHHAIPFHTDGMRIGLLGGSFNPPHEAHRAISLFALKRLQLDRVWWLVSPGNPLKDSSALPSLDQRIEAAIKVAAHPRIDVSGLETVIGTRYTMDTIAYLRRRCSTARFVWIMGADNLAQFHRWEDWQRIASALPIAVIDRPPESIRALASPAAQALATSRIDETVAATLAGRKPARLGVSDRDEIDPFLDPAEEPGWQLEVVKVHDVFRQQQRAFFSVPIWTIETPNPTWLLSSVRRDSARAIQ